MVSVNTVYQRVQAIANKEQRGYVTPQEFNLLANQAQMEIFEQYFYDINQFGRLHGNDTEYSDMLNILNEKISLFEVQDQHALTSNNAAYSYELGSELVTNGTFLANINNWTNGSAASGTITWDPSYYLKLSNDGSGSSGNPFCTQDVTTEVGALYRITCKIDPSSLNASGSNPGTKASITFDQYTTQSVIVGQGEQTVTFFAKALTTTSTVSLHTNSAGDTADFALFTNVSVKKVSGGKVSLATNIYRLGTIMYKNPTTNENIELDKLLANEALYINSSPLAAPTAERPAYVLGRNYEVSIYPSTILNDIYYNYVMAPTPVNWGFNLVENTPLFNLSKSTNFELHPSEETTLVNKILELFGILLQKPGLEASGNRQDTEEKQQEKI
tara:strand:+ start:1320 stop:2480 length:1161 start_codon:yes stop_codon:yes gene_type:complete